MYQVLPALPYCKRWKAGRGTGNEASVFPVFGWSLATEDVIRLLGNKFDVPKNELVIAFIAVTLCVCGPWAQCHYLTLILYLGYSNESGFSICGK